MGEEEVEAYYTDEKGTVHPIKRRKTENRFQQKTKGVLPLLKKQLQKLWFKKKETEGK